MFVLENNNMNFKKKALYFKINENFDLLWNKFLVLISIPEFIQTRVGTDGRCVPMETEWIVPRLIAYKVSPMHEEHVSWLKD